MTGLALRFALHRYAKGGDGRTNAVFTMLVFIGGGLGSLAATTSYSGGGWTATACLGMTLSLAMLMLAASEPRQGS